MKRKIKIMLDHRLEGKQLDAANRVLTANHLQPIMPCTIAEMMNHMLPMPADKFTRINRQILKALAEIK